MSKIEYIGRKVIRQRFSQAIANRGIEALIYSVDRQQKPFRECLAAVYASGWKLGAFLWLESFEGILYPLDEWAINNNDLSFDISATLEKWYQDFGLSTVIVAKMPELPDSQKAQKHPLAELIKNETGLYCAVKEFEPYQGLLLWQKLKSSDKIDQSYFDGYSRLVEKIRRICPDKIQPDPATTAFLLAMSLYSQKRLEYSSSFSTDNGIKRRQSSGLRFNRMS